MKVILIDDVKHLGEEGEIVEVKDGYGRNYLIPQGLAHLATDGVVRARKEQLRQQERKRAKHREDAEKIKQELESTEVIVLARVGEDNRIFGTVTTQQIAVKLAEQGFEVDRRNIDLLEDVRVIGVYTAKIKLHQDVTATVNIRVEPDPNS